MDSQDYFERAERSNRLYHKVVISLLIIAIGVLIVAGIQVYNLNNTNHKIAEMQLNLIVNDIKNTNLNGKIFIKCLVDEGYAIGANAPQPIADKAIVHCINTNSQPVTGN